jgi:hypothetical protein
MIMFDFWGHWIPLCSAIFRTFLSHVIPEPPHRELQSAMLPLSSDEVKNSPSFAQMFPLLLMVQWVGTGEVLSIYSNSMDQRPWDSNIRCANPGLRVTFHGTRG